MITTRETSSESDVLYQFALSYHHPDVQQLDDFVRRYPGYADALTTLAIELALEHANSKEDETAVEAYQPDAETAAMLSRAMSRFQNRLYAVRAVQTAVPPEHLTKKAQATRDLFGWRSRDEMQRLSAKLDVSQLFLKRMRDREIRSDTLTDGFIHYVAQTMEEPQEDVALHFAGKPQIAAHQYFKSEVTPTAGLQLTFEEAVRSSGLTPEQQARLLAL